RLDARRIEGIAVVVELDVLDTFTQALQLADAFAHVVTGAEHTEVVLHDGLQLLAQRRHALAGLRLVQLLQPTHGGFDVGFGRRLLRQTTAQHLFDVQAGRTTEHDQVDEGVAAQAVGAVHGYTGGLAYGEEPIDD